MPTENTQRLSGLRGLIVLNAALLSVLGIVCLGARVEAQAARPRGEYLAVGGAVQGTNAEVVWIVDSVSQELIALSYDYNTKALVGVGYRNLANDAATRTRR
jgi:hypothetical protein